MNLFQSSGAVESSAKLNESEASKKDDSPERKKYKGLLPPIVDPRKLKGKLFSSSPISAELDYESVLTPLVDDLNNATLKMKEKPKNPKVQVVEEGRKFDRRRTFIKNWEYDEKDEESKQG